MILNSLIKVASGLMQIGILIFIGIGAVMGGAATNGETTGYVLGGIAGFCVSSIVFGVVAAIFDMQSSLRVLADAARRAAIQQPVVETPLSRESSPILRK